MSDLDSDNLQQSLAGGFDLGAFLAQQRAEGIEDSAGEFTVSSSRALKKLSQFSLTSHYAWLLKLVQAVVLWECEELKVTQTRISTSFMFKPTTSFPQEKDVIATLQHGGANKTKPLDQLCIALRSLVEQAGLAFVLAVHGDEPSEHPVYSGEDVSKLSERERMKWAQLADRGVRLTVSHFKGKESFTGRYFPTFTQVERRDIKINSVLEDAVLFCPIPVRLDGRTLNCLVSHRDWGFSFRSRPVLLSGIKGEGLPRLRVPPSYEEKMLSLRTTRSRAARGYNGARDFDVWYYVLARQPANMRMNSLLRKRPTHEILWIQNGVVVERAEAQVLTDICSLRILISAADYGTDMSGLSLTRSEERDELQARIVDLVTNDIVQRFSEPLFLDAVDTDEHSEREPEENLDQREHSLVKDNIAPSLGLGLMVAVSTPGIAPFWMMGGAAAGASALAGVLAQKYRDSDYNKAKRRAQWLELVPKDLRLLGQLSIQNFKLDRGTLGPSAQAPEEMFKPRQR